MKQSIENLTGLFINTLSPSNFIIAKELLEEVLYTEADVRILFIGEYFTSLTKKQRARYVQSIQTFCVQMIDIIDDYSKQIDNTQRKSKPYMKTMAFYQEVQKILLSLLDYIESNYGHEMDSQQRLPEYKRAGFNIFMEQQLAWLQEEKCSQIDESLINLIIHIAGSCQPEIKYAYASVIFWQQVFSSLQDCPELLTKNCLHILISHNFNEVQFVDYLIHYWSEIILGNEDDPSTIIYWMQKMNQIENSYPAQTSGGYQNGVDCKQMILKAIENKIQVIAACESTVRGKIDETIETNLSVSQLGLFLRLQVDANMIRKDNNTALIRQIAALYRTNRVIKISHENLYKKFYTCDPASISILRTYLINMLNLLKTY